MIAFFLAESDALDLLDLLYHAGVDYADLAEHFPELEVLEINANRSRLSMRLFDDLNAQMTLPTIGGHADRIDQLVPPDRRTFLSAIADLYRQATADRTFADVIEDR